jgi:preprotein translocase SecE subunit
MRTLVGTLPPDPEPEPHRPTPTVRPKVRPRRVGLLDFLRQVRAECRRIVVPSLAEVLAYSAVVLVCVTTMTAYAFALDVAFVRGVLRLLRVGG